MQTGLQLPDIVTNHDCFQNELVSLHNRHLVNKLPYPDWLAIGGQVACLREGDEVYPGWNFQRIMGMRQRIIERWIDGRRAEPTTVLQSILRFTGRRRRDLFRAWHRTTTENRSRGGVQAFIKVDYYTEDDLRDKPPRMIQYRGPQYNLELARYLGPAEDLLLHGPGLGPTRTPSCSKGMLPEERAQVMADKRYCFEDPVAVCMDYSAFDSTQFPHILKQEHQAWMLMCPSLPKDALVKQLSNECRTKNGLRYHATGTRMSGDRNTGGGNSLTNVANFYTICAVLGIKAEFLCDGDDSVAWMERADAEIFMRWAEPIVGKVFGMILKDCTLVEVADQEYYCQHKNVLCGDGVFRPYRDPRRVMTRLPWTPMGVRGAEAADLLAAKLVGEMLLHYHIPELANQFRKVLVRLLDSGLTAYRTPVSSDYLESFRWREGIALPLTDGLEWVRHWQPNVKDRVSAAELCRVYDISASEWRLLTRWADEVVFHPSLVAGCKKTLKLPKGYHGPEYCELCDCSEIPRG